MTLEQKIMEVITVYFDGGLGRGANPDVVKCTKRLMEIYQLQREELVAEIENIGSTINLEKYELDWRKYKEVVLSIIKNK